LLKGATDSSSPFSMACRISFIEPQFDTVGSVSYMSLSCFSIQAEFQLPRCNKVLDITHVDLGASEDERDQSLSLNDVGFFASAETQRR
jgi:hypothetical protein